VIAVWPALAVAVVGLVAGILVAVFSGLRCWRTLKRLRRGVGEELERISQMTREIETHLARSAEASGRLAVVRERLRRSRARLDVQLAAIREARATVTRAAPFLRD
jgi:uncharacterized membrane-anchored protein YhcB (DUF1043 family)